MNLSIFLAFFAEQVSHYWWQSRANNELPFSLKGGCFSFNCCFFVFIEIYLCEKSADWVCATAAAALSTRREEYKPEKVEQLTERSVWLPACAPSFLCDCGRWQMKQRDVGYGKRLSCSWSRSHVWERSTDENELIPSQFFPRLSKAMKPRPWKECYAS